MDISFSADERAFQHEVRDFLADAVPPDLAVKVASDIELKKEDLEEWQSILNENGWLAYNWPVEYGGTGWDVVRQFIFENELARANAPRPLPFAFKMLAPVLMEFGSGEQCSYWLPRMLNNDDWWCQGYSEPGAGSDLASLKTTAVRDGDHYIVNGQKTWTTLGQHANMIFCLVRTSTEGKPQQGISFLLIDLSTPGVEMRPIRTIDGGVEINEIFFTDARVPVSGLVGNENEGWTYAKYLLIHERLNIANVGAATCKLLRLRALTNSTSVCGRRLADDPHFAARIARVEIALNNTKITGLRVLSEAVKGDPPGAESSMLKILGSEIMQELDSLLRRALGRRAQVLSDDGDNIVPAGMTNVSASYFNNRKLSIFAGSNEIQKNIITKMVLGF